MFVELAIGVGLFFGGLVAWAHWDEIKAFIRDLTNTVVDFFATVCRSAWHSVKIFAELTREGMVKILHQLYYIKNGKKMIKNNYSSVEMSVSEFPADVQESLRQAQRQGGGRIEITDEMERELQMRLC